jgi:uncharacterized protein (TIGR00251 family)
MATPWYLTTGGVVLRVHLQPRASRNRFLGLHGEAVKIALTAPPVDGAANAALLELLATTLHLPRTACVLQTGEKSRDKRVLIRTPTPDRLIQQFEALLLRVDKKRGGG